MAAAATSSTGRGGGLRRAGLAAAAAALLLLALSRGAGLAAVRAPAAGVPVTAGGVPLEALGERRWYGWAQRHPAMPPALAAAAEHLPAGARVVWVVPPGIQTPWVEIMALYHLPAAWTVAVRPRGAPFAAGPRAAVDPAAQGPPSASASAPWRVDVYADGRVWVRQPDGDRDGGR